LKEKTTERERIGDLEKVRSVESVSDFDL
jgi:hypothetical protein